MISISPPITSSHQTHYYLALSVANYYANRQQEPGRWGGKGAALLGLSGVVNQETLKKLFEGFDPKEGSKLVQNAGKSERKKAHDLVCSPPKSVSVLWAMSDARTRNTIEAIHDDAVQVAVEFLEENAAFTRRGKAGHAIEKAALVIACFRHATSRNLDPQLHTHLVTLNLGVRSDGTTGALWDHEFYALRRKADLIYSAHLAMGLRLELALKLELDDQSFHIQGVSKKVCEYFSSRRAEILEFMAGQKTEGAKAASAAALQTRAPKKHASAEELFSEWHQAGARLGWGPKEAERVNRDREVLRVLERLEKLERDEAQIARDSWESWKRSRLLKPIEMRPSASASGIKANGEPTPPPLFENKAPCAVKSKESGTRPRPSSKRKRQENGVYTLIHRTWGDVLWKANLGILEIRIQMKRPYRKSWAINPASNIKLPALRIVPWRIKFFDSVPPHKRPKPEIVWKKSLLFSEVRLEKAQVFPNTPAWSPAQAIKFPRLKFGKKSKTLFQEMELEKCKQAQMIQRNY